MARKDEETPRPPTRQQAAERFARMQDAGAEIHPHQTTGYLQVTGDEHLSQSDREWLREWGPFLWDLITGTHVLWQELDPSGVVLSTRKDCGCDFDPAKLGRCKHDVLTLRQLARRSRHRRGILGMVDMGGRPRDPGVRKALRQRLEFADFARRHRLLTPAGRERLAAARGRMPR